MIDFRDENGSWQSKGKEQYDLLFIMQSQHKALWSSPGKNKEVKSWNRVTEFASVPFMTYYVMTKRSCLQEPTCIQIPIWKPLFCTNITTISVTISHFPLIISLCTITSLCSLFNYKDFCFTATAFSFNSKVKVLTYLSFYIYS